MDDHSNSDSRKALSPEQNRALRGLIGVTTGGIVCWHILQGNVLSLFADRIGFSPFAIGILFLAIQLPAALQILSARYVDTHGCKRMVLRVFSWGVFLLAPFLLAPQLGAWLGRWALVGGVFLGLTAFAVSNHWALAGWMPLVRRNLPEGRRAELAGRMNQVSFRIALLVLLICSLVVKKETAVLRFQLIFLLGAAVAASRAFFARFLKDVEVVPARVKNHLLRDLNRIWRDVPFRRLMFFIGFCFFSFGVIGPFRPLYLKKLGFSDRFAFVATVLLVTAAYSLTARVWGVLADRFGSRGVYGIGGIGTVLSLLIIVFPRRNSTLDAGLVILGIAAINISWGALDAGNIFRMFTIVPRENQSLYMAFYSICTAGAVALGSFVGGALIKLARHFLPEQEQIIGLDYRIMFVFAALLMALATLYSRRLRELNEISTPSLLMHLRLRTQRWLAFGRSGAFTRFRKKPPAKH